MAIDAARPSKVFVHGSARCGECHEKMFDEWKPSAHALAASSPLYLAARKNSGNDTCGDRCHAPLVKALGAAHPVASEGITCDVCHTLRDPKPSPKGSEFRLAIDDMVKYGPRCDLDDHYFHRMGCSKEHATAEICGGCHWWERNGVPVFTEYKEWRDGPDAAKGVACQSCHMPEEKAPLANGSPARTGVPHHGLLGVTSDLRKRAVAVEVTANPTPDGEVELVVAVTNTTAGHYIPSGLPERRIEVRLTVGTASKTWWLGRQLVDDSGAFAPFWAATKVAADTRIAPGATWRDGWTTTTADSAKVEVVYLELAPEAAERIGVKGEEYVLATVTVPLAKLPKTVTYVPPAPGKRGKKAP